MKVFCPDCGNEEVLTPQNWRCKCGGAWEMLPVGKIKPEEINPLETSVWRYKPFYGLDFDQPKIVMGAGWTPLLPLNFQERNIYVKPEYFAPTFSFKDRGTEVMINILAHQGVTHIAEDSSGNAGASVAAFAARAKMRAEIFVPAHASAAKQSQIAIYGAQVNPIPGPRVNSKLAAIKMIEQGVTYASHAFHPGFLLGQTSVAYEVWEQMGRKSPDWYVVPVGQGVHMLGVWLGFKRLYEAGLVKRIPKLVGVQAELLAPLCHAFEAGLDHVPGLEPLGTSIAEGLAIAEPVRGRRLLQAVRDSGGTCIMVKEDEIRAGREKMSKSGFYIEPTSATVIAALPKVFELAGEKDVIVVPLTGCGLKGSPQV